MSASWFRASWLQLSLAVLALVAIVVVPLLLAGLLDRVSVRSLALAGVVPLVFGIAIRLKTADSWSGAGLILSAVSLGFALYSGNPVWLLLLPAIANLELARIFAESLRGGHSIVERGARILQPLLPDFARPYCRKVTAIWTFFFLVNAAIIGWLAVASSVENWRAYAGPIYPSLICLLVIVEASFRKLYFRNYTGRWSDRVLSRLFPAENTELGRRSTAHIREMRRRQREEASLRKIAS